MVAFGSHTLRLVLVAIIIRLLLMPFLFQPDIKTQYFHANFLSQGIFNIYSFIDHNKNTLSYKDTFNYPPLAYFMLGGWNVLVSPVGGDTFYQWLNKWGESWFSDPSIFRFLFILKLPYLILDVLMGLILSTLVERKFRITALVLWFFNPISLYIIYGLANFDIVPTFCTLLSIYFLKNEKLHLSGLLLGLGVAIKIFPLLFVPFYLVYLLKKYSFKQIISFLIPFSLVCLFPAAFFIKDLLNLPQSGLLTLIIQSRIGNIPIFYFTFGSLFILFLFAKNSWKSLSWAILAVCVNIYLLSHSHPQWFLWFLPFLVIFSAENFCLIILDAIFMLGFILSTLLFQDKFLTTGILSPIFPGIIYNLGSVEETLFSHIEIKSFYQVTEVILALGLIPLIFFTSSFKFSFSKLFNKIPRSFNFNNRILLISLCGISALFFLSILTASVVYLNKSVPVSKQNELAGFTTIYQGHPLTEEFVSNFDNIDSFLVRLKNRQILNTDQFIFSVKDGVGNSRELAIAGSNIGEDDWVRFPIEPLVGIYHQPIQMKLSSKTPTDSLAIIAFTNKDGFFEYKSFGKGHFQDTLVTQGKDLLIRFMSDTIFSIFYLVLLIIMIVGLISSFYFSKNNQRSLKVEMDRI